MSAPTQQLILDAARAAHAAGDRRRAAELYAALQIDELTRRSPPVGGVQ